MKKKKPSKAIVPISPKNGVSIQELTTQTPEELAAKIKAQLRGRKGKNVPLVQKLRFRNPVTDKVSIVTLDRTGHNEAKLILALADKKMTREQKDHELSMYLWERGKESSSLLVDLIRYKGQHSKESRMFHSRMRYDFEMFAKSFVEYLQNEALVIGRNLGVDVRDQKKLYMKWLGEKKNTEVGHSFRDYALAWWPEESISMERCALINLGILALDEADALQKGIDDTMHAREATKGGGIYVDRTGRAFNVNDAELDEIIKQDRKLEREAEQENFNAPI